MKVYIYGLRDPDTNIIRYIGKTTNLYKREHEHIHREGKTRKDRWIEELKKEGKEPFVDELEECDDTNWHEREIYYINKYKSEGNPLLNSYNGIQNRTDTTNRKTITQILADGEYFIHKDPILIQHYGERKQHKKIVMKLSDGEYLSVYGKNNDYYYVFSAKGEKYYIPKTSKIYKEDELPILIEKIDITTQFHGTYNSNLLIMNRETILQFTDLLISSVIDKSPDEILKLEDILGISKRSIFLKFIGNLNFTDNLLKEVVLNIISDMDIGFYKHYKSMIKEYYWSAK